LPASPGEATGADVSRSHRGKVRAGTAATIGGVLAAVVKLVSSGLPLLAAAGNRSAGGKKDDKKDKKGKGPDGKDDKKNKKGKGGGDPER
jgi:hypothetical protein